MTNAQIQSFLAARGKTGTPIVDYLLVVDDVNGTNPRIDRWNEATLGPIPTEAEIATMQTAQFALTSRQKDLLATVALVVRARGIPAWNAMTTPQKVAATQAEADVWTTIRSFLEANA